jgi:hypothetical protein
VKSRTSSADRVDLRGLGAHWSPTTQLVGLERTRTTNHRRYGTITRYRAVRNDGVECEVIHGQALRERMSPTQSAHLTVGTAPPLSLGPEGLLMHFLLKSMDAGLDGIVFGPERSTSEARDETAVRAAARGITFPSTAHVSHLICDRLATETSTDLATMLWTGVSLGAIKGITFVATAPEHGRTIAYSQFVVPASPNPQPFPTEEELRRFMREEIGAMARVSAELLAHDMRDRMFSLNQSVLRSVRPGLMMRYAKSVPRDSVSRIFTEAWRNAVVTGDAGVAASALPTDRLVTFELYDADAAGPVAEWQERLREVSGTSIRVVVKHGHHTDSLRLSNQRERARHIGKILAAVRAGTPIAELTHPYA